MKQLWLILILLSLIAVACNNGAGRDNDKNDDYTSADTIAVLRMVETMYSGDERPELPRRHGILKQNKGTEMNPYPLSVLRRQKEPIGKKHSCLTEAIISVTLRWYNCL